MNLEELLATLSSASVEKTTTEHWKTGEKVEVIRGRDVKTLERVVITLFASKPDQMYVIRSAGLRTIESRWMDR